MKRGVFFYIFLSKFSFHHSIFFLVGFNLSMSASGSSFAFSGRTIRQCHHGRCETIRTTKTRRNPGRLFYTCALPQTDPDNCQFFQWVEEENQVSNPSSITRESMIMADLNLQIEALQKKMRNLTNIVLLGFSILIIMLVLGGIYFRKNL